MVPPGTNTDTGTAWSMCAAHSPVTTQRLPLSAPRTTVAGVERRVMAPEPTLLIGDPLHFFFMTSKRKKKFTLSLSLSERFRLCLSCYELITMRHFTFSHFFFLNVHSGCFVLVNMCASSLCGFSETLRQILWLTLWSPNGNRKLTPTARVHVE